MKPVHAKQRAASPRLMRWIAALPAPTIKVALFGGFALICATWLLTGSYFTRRMTDLQRRANAISERYTEGQGLLTTVRSQVLVGSVYVRDALLDPDRDKAVEYRRKLQEAYSTASQALQRYVPVADGPAERDRVARLRADIDDFRVTVLNVLGTDSGRWAVEAHNLLKRDIMPKREGVIRVTDEVQSLNRAAFVQQQSEIAEVYRSTQRRLWASFGVAVFVSLGIALFATSYVGRLEDRLHRQRVKEADNTRDLQRLSMKLITAQEEAQRVVARELHDEVGQALTAIKVELALAQRAIDAAGAPRETLDAARSISESALHTVRDLSHLLHPAMLDDLGLSAAVDSYLKGFGRRHGLRAELVQDHMETRLHAVTETAAYRIIQEALTNIARHAHATSCRVYLQRLPDALLVTVEDDGVGFSPDASKAGDKTPGLGLIGIRERVTQLGGTLLLESSPRCGTRLTVELPARADVNGAGQRVDTSGRDAVAPKPTLQEVLGG
jgi:signal transduction histidine kinase